MFNDCIIMAGGSGTRLWPASTSSRPKQFLNLPAAARKSDGGEALYRRHSFFIEALERALAVTDGDGLVIIVAGKNHVNPIVDECTALNAKDRKRLVLIPEPMARNTAPAIACALFYLNAVSEGKTRSGKGQKIYRGKEVFLELGDVRVFIRIYACRIPAKRPGSCRPFQKIVNTRQTLVQHKKRSKDP